MSSCSLATKPPLQHNRRLSALQPQPRSLKLAAHQTNATQRSQTFNNKQQRNAFGTRQGGQPQQYRQLLMHSSDGSNYTSTEQLDLTEENIEIVLADARVELMQMFDETVGMTGRLSLAELDGPFVKLGFTGRFWHARQMVLDRVGAYLISRIPEILDVSAADEAELSDSPAMFGQAD